MKEYALYKGEELLIIGTVREISQETGLTPKRVRDLGTTCYKKKLKENHNARVLVLLDDDEMEG